MFLSSFTIAQKPSLIDYGTEEDIHDDVIQDEIQNFKGSSNF